jgi:lipopolysaccharide export system permease protein
VTVVDRYLFRETGKVVFLCIAGFTALFLVVDLAEKADDFLRHQAGTLQVLKYYSLRVPEIFVLTAPVAVLIAVLASVSVRARGGELTALFAGGLSLPRVSLPILAWPLLVSLAAFGASETAVPRANREARLMEREYVKTGSVAAQFSLNRYWIRGEGAIVSARVIRPERKEVEGFLAILLTPDFRPLGFLEARRAAFLPGKEGWLLSDGVERTAEGGFVPVPFRDRAVPLKASFDEFVAGETPPAEMTFAQLREYVAEARGDGYDVGPWEAELHGKASYPLLNLAVGILAVPLALSGPRSGGAWKSVGLGLLAGFACWILLSFSLSLGKKGSLPPAAAAWLPNAVVLSAAALLYRRAAR